MDFAESESQAAFRRQVKEFLAESLPANWRSLTGEEREAASKAFLKALADRGWNVPAWPEEYGGAGLGYYEQFIFNEEMAKARAPGSPGVGVPSVGPSLMTHGSEEQKKKYLPAILDMSITWCQGLSEPSAGSDLANVQTKAVLDGDHYVVNGQKMWTSHAHRADMCYLMLRTDPDAPKHRGISVLLVDMKSPGIEVRPIITADNNHHTNEVFFENVQVPTSSLLGELNRGWYSTTTVLNSERSLIRSVSSLAQTVEDIAGYVREQPPGTVSPQMRGDLAQRHIEVNVGRMIAFRVVSMQERGIMPTHEASCQTLFLSELAQRVARTGMGVAGLYGGGSLRKHGRFGRSQARRYLGTVLSTIVGGTSEIQRNVIATRGLGLPRA